MQKFLKFYYLTFMYSSTCFGHPHAHHQEFNCSSSLWFYRWSVVVAVLLVVVGYRGYNSQSVKLTTHHPLPWCNCTYAPSLRAEAVNSVLRKVFGPEKEQVASDCIKVSYIVCFW